MEVNKFASTKKFETEPDNLFQKIGGIEKIRLGTIELMKTLQGQNHKLFIYTTSLRSTNKIWWTFFSYGLKVDKIINQKLHKSVLRENYTTYSKYPPAFGIDVHIDDSKGVEIEGNRHHFNTIILSEDITDWTNFILQNISNHLK